MRKSAMFVLLLLLLPVLEILVTRAAAGVVGTAVVLAWVLLMAPVGVVIIRLGGASAIRRAQVQFASGQLGAEVLDDVLVVVAGGLLALPGVLTDVMAAALLVPPVRHALRRVISTRLARRFDVGQATFRTERPPLDPYGRRMRDVEVEVRTERPPSLENVHTAPAKE